jgi:transposase InsO family protein
MPWKVSSPLSERLEFVLLAAQAEAHLRQLCRRFGISPTTGYKWVQRFQATGAAGLQEQSRRPHHSPTQTSEAAERAVIELRRQHPAWGGRKLRARLLALGHQKVPSPSTITSILQRHQLVNPQESAKHRPFHRFEHAHPNDLWQMDFKGDFRLGSGRCYPLTVLDDHSRFNLGLVACADQTTATTQLALSNIFRRYGLPWRMTMDNGKPWAAFAKGQTRHTHFSAWLIRLGVRVSHSRPYHPQTQGKDERFHRTLGLELLRDQLWPDFGQCQQAFDRWRETYNLIRPHEALKLAVPASRYQPSRRAFPETLPAIEYGAGEVVRKVGERGQVKYRQRKFFVGDAFGGLHVALRATTTDGLLEVYFCHQKVGTIDLKAIRSGSQEVSTMSPNTCP